jgi:hypothetical protein
MSKHHFFVLLIALGITASIRADKVSYVELEVLLIDNKWVCSKQLDLKTTVEADRPRFSFETENLPGQRYVRTYYVIHYGQES